ncbi:Elongator complex protein 5 [Tricladium varicosporioides]|nr:Elongator complex protein 5 [Hymenoscyphus varicosporioides]
MAPTPLQQRRTHNTLLFQKLLNLRDGASPFTLVLDSLEQSDGPVVREFVRRAKISKSKVIFISFTTLRKKVPFDHDVFISTRGKSLSNLRTEILSHIPPPTLSTTAVPTRTLLIIDTLTHLSTTHIAHLSPFLSSLLISPTISLLATYHLDIPIPSHHSSGYQPDPLITLTYLSTCILTLSPLSHTLARKRARDRSLQEPVFGLSEHREGIFIGLKGSKKEEGLVVKMELRRRSGRGIVEDFVLLPPSPSATVTAKAISQLSTIILLDEHPLYTLTSISHALEDAEGEKPESTFNLGLTEKQRREREGVILPYFDAQKDGGASGAGEGGRILYEMGAEDREDFDDEEDEI